MSYYNFLISILRNVEEIIVFDTETTGLSSSSDRIIEIAATKLVRQQEGWSKEYLHEYINPCFPLPSVITKLTGITDEQLSGCQTEEEAFKKIYDFFGESPQAICCHNVPFDKSFLSAMYSRYGEEFSPRFEIDTLVLSKKLFCNREVPNHKLGTMAEYYGIDEGGQFHTALYDAKITGKLLNCLIKDFARIAKKA